MDTRLCMRATDPMHSRQKVSLELLFGIADDGRYEGCSYHAHDDQYGDIEPEALVCYPPDKRCYSDGDIVSQKIESVGGTPPVGRTQLHRYSLIDWKSNPEAHSVKDSG